MRFSKIMAATAALVGLGMPTRDVIGHQRHRRNGYQTANSTPVYYRPPAPTRLNRSKHWNAFKTYADARRYAVDHGFTTSLRVR